VLKEDRNPERGWPPGIEGTRRLRLDADHVEFSQSGGNWSGIQKLTGGYDDEVRRVEEGRVGESTTLETRAILDENPLADVMGPKGRSLGRHL
jgi:hypothetical protein